MTPSPSPRACSSAPVSYTHLFVVLAGIDFSRFRAQHLALERLRKNVSLGLDGMPAPADRIERDYQAALRALWDDRAHVVSRSDAAMSDMRDYYTLWAHQIKTPRCV